VNPWRDPDPEILRFGETLKTHGAWRIHDIGCGTGRHALALSRAGFCVIATDIDFPTLAAAVAGNPGGFLPVAASMLGSPFSDARFDGIVAFNVVYHTRRADMEKALAEAYRTLRPGGLLYLTLATPEHGSYGRGAEVEANTFLPVSGVLHHFSDREEAEVLLARFQVIRWDKSALDYHTRQGDTIRCIHWRAEVKKPEG